MTMAWLVLYATCGAHAADVPSQKSQDDLWLAIRGKKNPRLDDGFELIEGFPLTVCGDGIGSDSTALSSILTYQFASEALPGRANEFFLTAQLTTPNALLQALKGKRSFDVGDPTRQRLFWRFVKDELAAAGKRVEEAREVGREKAKIWKTAGVRNAYLVDLYLRDVESRSLPKAIRLFAEERHLKVVVQCQDVVTWDCVKEAIDKQIPVVLQSQDPTSVALGYHMDRDKRHLFVYRPTEAQYRTVKGSALMTREDRESEIPWIRNARKAMERREVCLDMTTSAEGEMPRGLISARWDSVAHCRAYYVYGWEANTERLFPMLLRRLKAERLLEGKERKNVE